MKIKIISPAGAFGAYDGEDELTSILRDIAVKYSKDSNGEWAEKYGTEFENDEFIMRCYYWGDCDCGWDDMEFDEPHSKDCYQSLVDKDLEKLGWKKDKYDFLDSPKGMKYDECDKIRDKVYKKYCNKFNLTFPNGCAVHCTCDHEENFKKWFEENKKGKNGHSNKCALELPNFLHKKTGFEVRWYKYLGRDMEVNMKSPIKELKKLL